jgi:hypothetical protein
VLLLFDAAIQISNAKPSKRIGAQREELAFQSCSLMILLNDVPLATFKFTIADVKQIGKLRPVS